MRNVLILLMILLLGCTTQECPACDCPEPEETVVYVNDTTKTVKCITANITMPLVAEHDNQTNDTNVSAFAEPELEGVVFADGEYILVMDDVSIPTSSKGSCGIFSVQYNWNSSIIDRLIICPGYSKHWKAPNGETYRIQVIDVAAGYTKDIKWAEVQIFS